jgi:hypothetical protein
VAHANEFGDFLFKLLDERAVVRQPAAVEHVVDSLEQATAVADVRPPDV